MTGRKLFQLQLEMENLGRGREREKAIDNESVHRSFRAGRSCWAGTLGAARLKTILK